jgi:hypothetical protein
MMGGFHEPETNEQPMVSPCDSEEEPTRVHTMRVTLVQSDQPYLEPLEERVSAINLLSEDRQ